MTATGCQFCSYVSTVWVRCPQCRQFYYKIDHGYKDEVESNDEVERVPHIDSWKSLRHRYTGSDWDNDMLQRALEGAANISNARGLGANAASRHVLLRHSIDQSGPNYARELDKLKEFVQDLGDHYVRQAYLGVDNRDACQRLLEMHLVTVYRSRRSALTHMIDYVDRSSKSLRKKREKQAPWTLREFLGLKPKQEVVSEDIDRERLESRDDRLRQDLEYHELRFSELDPASPNPDGSPSQDLELSPSLVEASAESRESLRSAVLRVLAMGRS